MKQNTIELFVDWRDKCKYERLKRKHDRYLKKATSLADEITHMNLRFHQKVKN
ncbi:hypothetical protein [Lactiplantibacillus plantarum]|uniref:hypothetical protein n=1 Tax=Lactiplantibacillus plantarum TaxID=1590 RepID=UPI0012BAB8DC|nr:hypothetical protein [Lactiplantibacillus plantarum]